MIYGLGTDIIRIERLREMITRYGEDFIGRIFTPEERVEAESRRDPAEYYAGRWAVKEAVSKALGCGIGEHCSWQDIKTLTGANGRPQTRLDGKAAATARRLAGKVSVHVSVSHEVEYACATVILENLGESMK